MTRQTRRSMISAACILALGGMADAGFAGVLPVVDFDRTAPASADWLRVLEGLPTPPAPKAVPLEIPKPVVVAADGGAAVIGWEDFASRLARAEVVYAGEQHDQASHHLVQLEVLREVFTRRGRAVMGLEMIDITRQSVLDDFAAGRMSEAEFKEFWKAAWGFSFEIYRPLFVFAKENRIPIRALNAPRSVISSIARRGLDALTPEERALLPEKVDPITDPRYLAYVKRALNGHGQLPPEREAKMLQAMAAWNETMGQSVVDILAEELGPVVVVAGMGHMFYGAGIGESVSNRSDAPQGFVLPYPLDGASLPLSELLRALRSPDSEDIELAEFFRLLPAAP